MNQLYTSTSKILLLYLVLIVSGVNGLVFSHQECSPQQMPLEAGLMYMFARDHPSLFEVEKAFGLSAPVALKSPTMTDPVWWFVYEYQGKILELGAIGREPIAALETINRDTVRYAGYFKVRTPDEAVVDDGYSTYCVPTVGRSLPNRYTEFLKEYDMRTPISIKDLEIAMELPEPINIESPFIDPMWLFFYETPERCIIRLYGIDQGQNGERSEISARACREEFLFTGYWVVACQEPEPKTIFERLEKFFFRE